MSQIKIKKSKNLRFQLISLLYLVFIAISAIQIPDEWIRINRQLNKYLAYANSSASDSKLFTEIDRSIEELQTEFADYLGQDKISGEIVEPKGYSKTDNFFVMGPRKGWDLHSSLWKLDSLINNDPSYLRLKAPYASLFQDDINNGLMIKNGNRWVQWKFSHVPAIIAQSILEDLKLRLNILQGNIETPTREAEKRRLIQLSYNTEAVPAGDTVVFVLNKNSFSEAIVSTPSADTVLLDMWKGDSLFFIPKTTGKHQLKFTGMNSTEELTVNVLPAAFLKYGEAPAVKKYFEGQSVGLRYTRVLNPSSIKCDCSNTPVIDNDSSVVKFVPETPGWCKVSMYSGNQLLLKDSAYVHATPEPFIRIGGQSHSTISYERLASNPEIQIEAFHPQFKSEYNINQVKYSLVGAGIKDHVSTNNITVSSEDLENLEYLIIHQIAVSTPYQSFELDVPHVLRITKS